MSLRGVNERLKKLAKKAKPIKKWQGYPPPPPITEEGAINIYKILYEVGGGEHDPAAGVEFLSSIIGEDNAVEFYNGFLCTDDSFIRA